MNKSSIKRKYTNLEIKQVLYVKHNIMCASLIIAPFLEFIGTIKRLSALS